MKAKDIGMGIKPPKKVCNDSKCPFHGQLKIRGRTFIGTVISDRMQKTVKVEWLRKILLPKYERYAVKRTRIKAHNPDCIKAEEGDIVKIYECRPISKTVNFVIVENLGKEKGYAQKMELLEEGKKKFALKDMADGKTEQLKKDKDDLEESKEMKE